MVVSCCCVVRVAALAILQAASSRKYSWRDSIGLVEAALLREIAWRSSFTVERMGKFSRPRCGEPATLAVNIAARMNPDDTGFVSAPPRVAQLAT
jgi:hypothetical protein